MGIGTSLVLIAIGAILRFAVSVSTNGFNIHTIGVILMIIGGVGLLISLLWLAVWSDRDRRATAGPRGRYAEDDVPPARGY